MKYLIAILPILVMLTLAPALTAVPNNAYAQNDAIQSISQIQGATQLGICLSGIDTFISCNNLSLQNQDNEGSNALAQDGGNGKVQRQLCNTSNWTRTIIWSNCSVHQR